MPDRAAAAAARVEDDDRLTRVAVDRRRRTRTEIGLAAILDTDPRQIRCSPRRRRRLGDQGLAGEYVLVATWPAERGTPVRWTETRTENLIALPHGRAQRIDFRMRSAAATGRSGAAAQPHPGRRRVPEHRRVPPQPDRPDGERVARIREDRRRPPIRRHEHDQHGRRPRRGPARGDPGSRARDRRVRTCCTTWKSQVAPSHQAGLYS